MSCLRVALPLALVLVALPAQAQPPMLAPNIGSRQLISDLQKEPHKLTLPPGLTTGGSAYWGLYKICVSEIGAVSAVTTVKSANAPDAPDLDARWMAAIKTWRYSPYLAQGTAVAFCYTTRLQLGGQASAPPGTVMVAPNVAAGLLLTDLRDPRHKPRMPDDLNRAGNVLWGLYKICVNDEGAVTGVRTIKSADASADGPWMALIRGWRYRPYSVDGRPVPFCYTLRLQVAAK